MALTTPRSGVAFEETAGPHDITFIADGTTIVYDGTKANGAATTMIGQAVSLSADNTVQLASDAEAIVGKLLLVESDGKCSVRTKGFVTLPGGAAAALTLGAHVVGALGAASAKGFVRASVSAESPKARGQIWNAGTTTAVGILLDA